MTLFSATLIAKDRESALLMRLYATPMTAADFILGYTLPLLPIALAQSLICFLIGIVLGMKVTVRLLWGALLILPVALFFIGLGLLFGSVLNQKQAGGICGALLTNLTAWLSGIWFDLELVGGVFKRVAELLPFYHGVQMEQLVFSGQMGELPPHLLWVLGYAVTSVAIAVLLFLRQMKKG
jgi:ABC-2 type transport system permease protein